MADGIAPAIDKVGAPEPTAPEAKAGAPTMDGPPSRAVSPPAPPNHDGKADLAGKRGEDKTPDGTNLSVGAPKPVEVTSVPETPVNGATPAGGTPRPELKVAPEPASAKDSPKQPVVISEVHEPASTPMAFASKSDAASEVAVDKAAPNGESKPAETAAPATDDGSEAVPALAAAPDATPAKEIVPATGEKRKVDEPATADKKAKVDGAPAQTNGGAPPRKVGRPRKEKKSAPPAVGMTARKTRSQGPADA